MTGSLIERDGRALAGGSIGKALLLTAFAMAMFLAGRLWSLREGDAVPFDQVAGHQNSTTSSPPATVSSARSPFAASVCLRNRTAPSTRRLFAPPG